MTLDSFFQHYTPFSKKNFFPELSTPKCYSEDFSTAKCMSLQISHTHLVRWRGIVCKEVTETNNLPNSFRFAKVFMSVQEIWNSGNWAVKGTFYSLYQPLTCFINN